MQHVIELLDLVTSKLEQVATSDAVVGQPIELGAVTVVPLSRISLGFGAGGGEGEGEGFGPGTHAPRKRGGPAKTAMMGKGTGGGSGGGAKIRPVGVAVISASGVEIFPITDRQGLLDRLLDRVPEIIDLVKHATGQDKDTP
jgi:uncharacterized spore protein YtfJ